MREIVKIGEISVDAGLVWVGDPCYLWENGTAQHTIGNWSKFCETLDDVPYPKHKDYASLGVVASPPYGDGIYSVYADIENGKAIRSITVKFVEDDEDA